MWAVTRMEPPGFFGLAAERSIWAASFLGREIKVQEALPCQSQMSA